MTDADGEGAQAPSAATPTDPAPPIPVRDLDRALAPVRRGLAFVRSGGAPSAYLPQVLDRQVERLRGLALPGGLADLVDELTTAVRGDDADNGADLATAWAVLARIDALVGLPLRGPIQPVRKPVQRDRPEGQQKKKKKKARSGRRGRKRGSRGRSERGSGGRDSEGSPRGPKPPGPRWSGDLDDALTDALEPRLAGPLAAAGLQTVRQVLELRPAAITTLEPVHGAGREVPEGRAAVGGRVGARWTTLHADGTATPGMLLVGAGPVRVTGRRGAVWRLQPDARAVVAAELDDGVLREAELVQPTDGRVTLPAWGLDVPDAVFREALAALDRGLAQVRDPVSGETLRQRSLPSLGKALAGVSRGDARAEARMAFDEALHVQLALTWPRYNDNPPRGIGHSLLHGFAGKVEQSLDLRLDDAQQAALEDIKRDLRLSQPMRRVLTGEVGAGKGNVAMMAAAMVAEGRAQVLVLATDALEAEQRFLHSEPILREGGLVARLVDEDAGYAVRDAIKRGEIHVVFGAIDLLSAGLDFRRLGLVVAVERERWGRASHLHRRLRNPRPDLLVLTAVPVGPRVLLTAYADHDVTVLSDPQRHPATIDVCRADARDRAYAGVREAIARGEQAVVVFPLVQGHDALDMREALRVVRALEADVLEGLRVGLFHGAMPREERQRAFDDFLHRRFDVLVATAPVEDGPRIPGACRVVIEQADRVEQWRLHRIVGFFSRAARPAEATLIVGELADDDAAARVERVLSARNGFDLTEALVKHEGLAHTVDEGCPPLPELEWLDLDDGLQTLLDARAETHRLLGADPSLRRGPHAQLARDARVRFERLWAAAEDFHCPIPESAPPERRRRRRRRRKR